MSHNFFFLKVILEAQGKAQKEHDVEDKTHLWVGKYLPNKCRITVCNNDSCCPYRKDYQKTPQATTVFLLC